MPLSIFDGEILRVDLTKSRISREKFEKYKEFIGGRGVNQYILFHEMPLNTHPFDPETILAIGAGLLCGTEAPGASRVSIDTKNIFTGGIGSSNVGGNFGPALRRAGITNIIITGKAEEVVYLYIDNGDVEIRDASHLKLKAVSEVNNILSRELGKDVHIMTIGPAGEKLVWPACVIVDNARAAGRSGTGAVFGAKNLKAIAVKGDQTIEVADPKKFKEVVKKSIIKMSKSPFNKRRMKYGVYCYEEPWGIESPYRNFSGKVPPLEKKMKLMADEFYKHLVEKKDCDSCPIRCWTIHEVEDNGKRISIEALEGNAIHNFGAKLDMDDPKDILLAHKLCDDLGVDEDVTSNVIAWAIECFEKGIINEKDTRGLKLEWGKRDLIFQLIREIAYREGFGEILAEGCKRASEKIGRDSDKCCVHVKGNDLFECLWMSVAWAFGVVVAPRGGTHTRGAVIEERMKNIPKDLGIELFGVPNIGGPLEYENKERLVVFMERLNAVLDAMGMCMFTHSSTLEMLLPTDYAELLSAATGWDINTSKLLYIGEKLHNVEKAYNVLHTSWGRKDDMPPERFVKVPLDGKYAIDLEKWNSLLDRYYELHGWDSEGRPTKETLLALGLEDIARKLEREGKLPKSSRNLRNEGGIS